MPTEIRILNLDKVLTSLEKRLTFGDKIQKGADKWLVIGLNYIQSFAPVDTGNLKTSYPRCSKVERMGPDEVKITWTSDVPYQLYQEKGTRYQPGTPHLVPGVHQSIPSGITALKGELNK